MNRLLFQMVFSFMLSGACSKAVAQQIVVDTLAAPGAGSALSVYHAALGGNAIIYSGYEYQDYNFVFSQGHPYFQSNKWASSKVTYGGSTYENVPLLYNLVTDNIVVLHDSALLKIQLVKDRVDSFSIAGHRFVHICADKVQATGLRCGFYDVMIAGNISFLVKRTKNLQTVVTDKVQVNVASKDHFYIGKNGVFTAVSSKADVLSLLSDQKKEVQRFIKKNRIRFRGRQEAATVQVLQFYNQLKG